MKIVAISDTHEQEQNVILPEGDVLVHAGDLTKRGSIPAINKVIEWFKTLSFKNIVVIAGNHDFCFQNINRQPTVDAFKNAGIIYLQDQSVMIDGLQFYGSPWQPFFFNWAFNLHRGPSIAEKWNKIPDDTDVLITHGPPYGILDLVENNIYNAGRDLHQGCEELRKKVDQLSQLKVHIFGHLHLNGGMTETHGNTIFANAAICTDKNQPTNKPIVIEI